MPDTMGKKPICVFFFGAWESSTERDASYTNVLGGLVVELTSDTSSPVSGSNTELDFCGRSLIYYIYTRKVHVQYIIEGSLEV